MSKILRAFEDIVQVELMRVRWEEIKRLQPNLGLAASASNMSIGSINRA
jgi:hypothetical protein